MKLKELIDTIKNKFSKSDTIVDGFDFSKYKKGDIVSCRDFPDLHNGNKYYDPLGNIWQYSCGTWYNKGKPEPNPFMFGINFKKFKYGDTVPGGTFKGVDGIEFTDPLGNEWCFGCGTWRNYGNPATRPVHKTEPRKPSLDEDPFWYKETITDEDIWGKNMH